MDYKDIIWVKQLIANGVISQEVAEKYIPELKESKGGWIKKEIINYLKEKGDFRSCWIAWLEKQGHKETTWNKEDDIAEKTINWFKSLKDKVCPNNEYDKGMLKVIEYCIKNNKPLQKEHVVWLEKQGESTDILADAVLGDNNDGLIADTIRYKKQTKQKSEPKFKVGDWIVHNERKNIVKIVNATPLVYKVVDILGYHHTITDTAIENDYHLWTIQDAKDGDVLVTGNKNIFIFKSISDCTVYDYCGLYFGKFFEYPSTVNGSTAVQLPIGYTPATKEQRDALMKAMADAGYTFDFEKRELKRIEQKSEPKFHKGDFIVHHGTENIYQVVAVINNQYQLKYGDTYTLQNCADVDRCARLYDVARDAKDGDVLAVNNEVFIYAHRKQMYSIAVAHCFVDSAGGFYFDGEFGYTEKGNLIHPATKEQRDLLFQKMKEAGYEWDAEKKELKKIEYEIEIPFGAKDSELQEVTYYIPKGFHAEIDDDEVVIKKGEKSAEWSGEDEKKINYLIALLQNSTMHNSALRTANEGIEKWLKSFKYRVQPQNCYNPYKEVVESIAEMCKHYDVASHSGLRDFYNNVKVKCKDAKEYDSLFPQNTWKPSDEQIKACKEVYADMLSAKGFDLDTVNSELNRMEKQLKKLREE